MMKKLFVAGLITALVLVGLLVSSSCQSKESRQAKKQKDQINNTKKKSVAKEKVVVAKFLSAYMSSDVNGMKKLLHGIEYEQFNPQAELKNNPVDFKVGSSETLGDGNYRVHADIIYADKQGKKSTDKWEFIVAKFDDQFLITGRKYLSSN